MTDPTLQVTVDPPLEAAEIAFLRGFTREAPVHRVWHGQPSARSPWYPTADGTALTLRADEAHLDSTTVVGWLRFLSREFLAPSSTGALDTALTLGLRAGHRLHGEVVIAGTRVVSVRNNRVEDAPAPFETFAPLRD